MKRGDAYRWLSHAMGRSPVHIGEMSAEDCERVVSLIAARALSP